LPTNCAVDDDEGEYSVYYGRGEEIIPRMRYASKSIRPSWRSRRSRFSSAILHDGLEEIGVAAFWECASLEKAS
jgi:hypothetical protein